ncbi:MAG: pitrilysin family protein [Pseudomonadota bacterium]
MIRIAALVSLIVAALPVRAAEQVTNFMLDNGMEVVVIEDRRAPVVVHMVWYKVGSADEPAGTSGIAHYLEHLMFKATENLEDGEFSKTVLENGGTDNAFTSFDYTAYFQRVAADRLGLMMEMEADRMANLRLDEDDIASERSVVIEERAQRTDSSPGAILREQMRAAQYYNHRYGIPIIGWRHEIEELGLADAQAFYDAHYAPNNAVLVVAGDVEPDEVRALAEEHYGVIPANPAIVDRDRSGEPPQVSERRLVYRDPRVAQPYFARTYLAPERNSGDQRQAAALTLLGNLLGVSGATSVLGEALEFEQQKAVYTSAFYRGMSLDATTFHLIAVPAAGVTLQQIEDAVDAEVAAFMEEGVDPAQLERIKAQWRASDIYSLDDVGSLARRYGAALTSGLTVEDVQAWPDVIQSITEDEIIAAAELVFDRSNAVTGWLAGPEEQAEVSQ